MTEQVIAKTPIRLCRFLALQFGEARKRTRNFIGSNSRVGLLFLIESRICKFGRLMLPNGVIVSSCADTKCF